MVLVTSGLCLKNFDIPGLLPPLLQWKITAISEIPGEEKMDSGTPDTRGPKRNMMDTTFPTLDIYACSVDDA